MKKMPSYLLFAVVLSVLLSCAGPRYLKTVEAKPGEVRGTFDLTLYGHRYNDDIRNIAFLLKEGGKYTFEVYAPAFDYTTKRGISAEEALGEAERWVKFHYSATGSRLSGIIDYEGNTIGYECRPLYSSLNFPFSDVLDVSYIIRDNKVVASVGLKPEISERRFIPAPLRLKE